MKMFEIGICARAICALLGLTWAISGSAYAQAPSPAANEGYRQLVIDVTITGDKSQPSVYDCPTGGLFKKPLKEILKGDKTYAFTLKISGDWGADHTYSPVAVTIKDRLRGTDCIATFQNFKYESPLFVVAGPNQPVFTVTRSEATIDQTGKAVTDTTKVLSKFMGTLANLPPSVASKASEQIVAIVSDFKDTADVSVSDQVRLGPIPPSLNISQPFKLGKKTYTIAITSHIEQKGSLFSPVLPFVGKSDAGFLLSQPVMPPSMANFQNNKDAVRLVTFLADDQRKAILAASDVASLDAPCNGLNAALTGAGLSAMDAAALSWAVVKTHPKVTGDAVDQIACLKTRIDLLALAGISLAPDPPPVAKQNPSSATIQWIAAVDDLPQQFFVSGDPVVRGDAAGSLFTAPVAVNDPLNVLTPQGVSAVDSSAGWYQLLDQGGRLNQGIFSRLGCYAYFEANDPVLHLTASTFFGIAQIDNPQKPNEPTDYVVQMRFAQAKPSEAKPKISEISAGRQTTPEILAAIRGTRKACGVDGKYRPKLLFQR